MEIDRKVEFAKRTAMPGKKVAIAKVAWLAAGWFCFTVGVVGVVVPGLPTTGPMLLALACFARGSDRLHTWLFHHRFFGPPLQRWQQHRIIPIRAKVVAVSMMAVSFVYVAWLSPLPTWLVVAVGCFIAVGMTVVLRLPHTSTCGSDPRA